MSPDSAAADRDAEPFVEVDPTGRYGRYRDLLGAGAVKKVYRAFNQEEGIEVAWNQVRLWSFSEDRAMMDRLFAEVRLLRELWHENVIALYWVWTDSRAAPSTSSPRSAPPATSMSTGSATATSPSRPSRSGPARSSWVSTTSTTTTPASSTAISTAATSSPNPGQAPSSHFSLLPHVTKLLPKLHPLSPPFLSPSTLIHFSGES